MRVFSVAGMTRSGKTTTIEGIIRELKKRRFSVGSIKEIHYEDFAIDDEGTNTYRHRAAGSELVTARGLKETDIMYPEMLPVAEILKFYTQDYVLMEGVTDYNVPIILCAADLKEARQHKDRPYFNRVFAISGLLSNSGYKSFEGIPVLNMGSDASKAVDIILEKVFELLPDLPAECCSLCGYDCRKLCSRILKGSSKRSECRIWESDIKLAIDGRKISLAPFVQDILSDCIKGIVQNLKGYKKGKKIEIIIEK